MTNEVEVHLGKADEVKALLSYVRDDHVDDYQKCALGFSQTLLRDLKYASWAVVRPKQGQPDDDWWVRITSPVDDVSAYAEKIPAFMAAARLGLEIYRKNREKIERNKLLFFPPQGMALAETRSVQLLHYPPYEARVFCDYLYSPTQRRYEGLLRFNGYDPDKVSLLERICDCAPLAGPGADATGIDEVLDDFRPYAKAMLTALLDTSGSVTQPVVAYGPPVHQWLHETFPKQVPQWPELFSILSLTLDPETGAKTPVICADHPSAFLFFDHHPPGWAVQKTRDDLITSRWQIMMSETRDADPYEVLEACQTYWVDRPDEVREICDIQKTEFGYDL
ncbi:MAG TPA: hypothetical protein VJ925_12190 [Longimicrobiales bacterium]|nr:hypothetical protein [Longimicrobiales bacterium]